RPRAIPTAMAARCRSTGVTSTTAPEPPSTSRATSRSGSPEPPCTSTAARTRRRAGSVRTTAPTYLDCLAHSAVDGAAEVGRFERTGHVLGPAGQLDLAREHDRRDVGDAEDLVRELLDDHDRQPFARDALHHRVQVLDDEWCQSHRQLVEQEHLRV